MRQSISAQSCDSVPPAPGWMVAIASRSSYSPLSNASTSRSSTLAVSSSSPCRTSAAEASSSSSIASSFSVSRSESCRESRSTSSRSASTDAIRRMTLRARSGSSQRSGAADCSRSALSSRCLASRSKELLCVREALCQRGELRRVIGGHDAPLSMSTTNLLILPASAPSAGPPQPAPPRLEVPTASRLQQLGGGRRAPDHLRRDHVQVAQERRWRGGAKLHGHLRAGRRTLDPHRPGHHPLEPRIAGHVQQVSPHRRQGSRIRDRDLAAITRVERLEVHVAGDRDRRPVRQVVQRPVPQEPVGGIPSQPQHHQDEPDQPDQHDEDLALLTCRLCIDFADTVETSNLPLHDALPSARRLW